MATYFKKANKQNETEVLIDNVKFNATMSNTNTTKNNNEGIAIITENSEILFIDSLNFFQELKTFLENQQEFFNVFANNQDIGIGQGSVLPAPTLIEKATTINNSIKNLLGKLP